MILPKYVAVQAYLEATGTAFAELRYIEPLIEKILEMKEITAEYGREILGHKSDVAKTIFNLFQHIGIIKRRLDPEANVEYFSLTNYGRFVLENKKKGQSIIQPLTSFFLTWLPFKIFLKYLLRNPGAELNEVRTNLGSQVVKHTTDIKNLIQSDIIRRGAYIPFNEMVIGKVLSNVGEYLGLVNCDKSSGPYYLSPLGKYVTNSIDFQNFQFKNLDPKLNPSHLALMDFVERGLKNIIVFANTNEIEHMKKFYQHYAEKMKIKHVVRIVYNKSNFNAVISLDSAFWSFTYRFSNITYDQIKVLEFNSKVMDYLEV
ncbi:MAG: hypothetical protein HZR80_00780 [Candidatus Heimdallarchaeota archaeon]